MQTTLSLDEVKEILEALKERYPQAITLPSSSICFATTNRQEALKKITVGADLILVVGDEKSSNSNRLKEIGDYRNIPSYLINNPQEINSEWLKNVQVISMTAGASTPDHVVQSCIQKLREFGVTEIEEVVHTEENVVFDVPRVIKRAREHAQEI